MVKKFIVGCFDDEKVLFPAIKNVRRAGYKIHDVYTPFPVHGLDHAMGIRETSLHTAGFIFGIAGTATALGCMGWIFTRDWPLDIGGKPHFPLPAFIPITFEVTILFASLAAVFGMLALNGLPEPYHPVFNVQRFVFATRDQFFLCIESRDPKFDLERTRQFLQSLRPLEVNDVPW